MKKTNGKKPNGQGNLFFTLCFHPKDEENAQKILKELQLHTRAEAIRFALVCGAQKVEAMKKI